MQTEMESEISKGLFAEVAKTYKDKGTLTSDILSALQFTFGGPLLPALDLLDKRNVTRLESPSGRYAHQVIGSSGVPYLCPAIADYCSCAAFKFSVLKKGDHIMCKHLLAIRLGESTDTLKCQDISDQELYEILRHMD